MVLEIKGLEIECIIGDLPEERTSPQTLTVDVALEIEENASRTDNLADTLDYAELSRRIASSLVSAKCRMIERAARIVADECLSFVRVRSVDVRVSKSAPFVNHPAVAARIRESKKAGIAG